MLTITELTENERPRWDAYVRAAPGGLPQHLSGWRQVLEKTNDYKTTFLMAEEDEQVVGVLPLFLVRSYLVGRIMTTMPGALCADSDAAAAALIARGSEIALQAKAKRLQLQDTRSQWPGNIQTSHNHVFWVADVQQDAESQWEQLPGNIRRQVRIARKNNLQVNVDRTGSALGAFYDVFSRFTHQMGTPVFGRNFLEHTISTFPDGFNIAVIYQDKKPIGAYFQLEMGNTIYGMWGATLREHLKLRPVYLAYWEMIQDAHAHGYHYLDMGRSPINTNAAKFKAQWGGISKPVYQQAVRIGREQPSESVTDRLDSDSKLHLFMQLWPKIPFPIVQYLGPKLRRHVPFA